MDYLMFVYKWTSRNLRKIITAILKSWNASSIKRVNYAQNYEIKDKKIIKHEEKILLIDTQKQEDLMNFLSKNFSQEIEKINIK
jgi:hypothetical protein